MSDTPPPAQSGWQKFLAALTSIEQWVTTHQFVSAVGLSFVVGVAVGYLLFH